MNIFFRVDASFEIGMGHVARCLTLAKGFREYGNNCTFICSDLKGNLISAIQSEGFEVAILPISKQNCADPYFLGDTNRSLNTSIDEFWEIDAKKVISAIVTKQVDLLIVDHYGLDVKWEHQLTSYVKKIMVIDDLADRNHYCDFLLDQNLVSNFKNRYQGLVSEDCITFLGPEYALLQPEYYQCRSTVRSRKSVERVLIFFGGVDKYNLTRRVICSLPKSQKKEIIFDVVVTKLNSNLESIYKIAEGHSNIFIHEPTSSLANLMSKADLAIGACGATSWERCCLGLPALVITVADNQKPLADELSRRGLVKWLGHFNTVTDASLKNAIQEFLNERKSWLKSCSEDCLNIVDGNGVKRVVSALCFTSQTAINVKQAKWGDESLLLEWANDALTRKNGLNHEKISIETHHQWFISRIDDPEKYLLYILKTDLGYPVGQVRFEIQDNGDWEVHYSVAPMARGRNLGKKILEAAISEFNSINHGVKIYGRVKPKNIASKKIFEALGFSQSSDKGLVIFSKFL